MDSEDKIVPITRGRRKPNSLAFAVIAGRTRVEGAVDMTRSRSEPAAVIEFAKRDDTRTDPVAATRDQPQPEGEETMSRIYRIDEHHRVLAAGAASTEGAFANAGQLAELVADWPLRRLAEVWNNLPNVRPLSRFENRGVAVQRIWRALHAPQPPSRTMPTASARRKRGNKTQTVLAMLQRPEGATLSALMQATRWQAHSVRGFLSRKVAKGLGLPLQSIKRDGERVYALPSAAPLTGN
jgi:hypothetical protein